MRFLNANVRREAQNWWIYKGDSVKESLSSVPHIHDKRHSTHVLVTMAPGRAPQVWVPHHSWFGHVSDIQRSKNTLHSCAHPQVVSGVLLPAAETENQKSAINPHPPPWDTGFNFRSHVAQKRSLTIGDSVLKRQRHRET